VLKSKLAHQKNGSYQGIASAMPFTNLKDYWLLAVEFGGHDVSR